MSSSASTRTRTGKTRTARLILVLLGLLLYGAAAPSVQAVAAGPLEAESAALSGGAVAESEHGGYTGTGYVGGYTDGHKGTASTAFTVQSAAAGSGSIAIRYANGTTATMTLSLYVNGTKVRQIALPATANWATWATRDEPVSYTQGANTIALTFTTSDSGNVNLDNITPTTPVEPGPETLSHQAEKAFRSGGPSQASTVAGYEGSGYLTGFTATGARAVFAVNAPTAATYPVAVRYRTTGTSQATLTLSANGTTAHRLTLPGTSGAWATATTDAPLRAQLNNLTLRTEPGDNGDLLLDGIDVDGASANAARGATVPYTTYELENGTTNASAIGPDRTYLTPASEASGRRAVVLDATGEYVQITLTRPANALTLRYSIPDNAAGTGIQAPLSVYADGSHIRDLDLTSKYAWVYGNYPYGNDPSQGSGHRFFDETRAVIGDFPAGTVLKFQKDSGDSAPSYTLDLVETETAPAASTMPAGFLSATDLGVTPDNGSDDTAALNSAVSTARSQGKGLWLPKGAYDISDHVNLTGIALRGAGEWHTVLRGKNGKGGLFGRGGTSTIQDLTIAGDVSYRDDANFHTAIEGDFGTGSTVQNVWIEHTKVGLWIDAPTDGLYVSGLRIRDTFADGVNLHKGTRNTEVSQSSVRNTGDDGLAMFSEAQAVTNCVFRYNTVQLPMLANAAAIYGGNDNRIEDNLLSDTVNASAGVAISTRNFPPAPLPFGGTTTVQRNTLQRTGGYEANWQTRLGALWIYADGSDITAPVLVQDNDILDSTYSGLLISWQKTVGALTVRNTKIDKAGHYGIEINAAGAGTFSGTTVSQAVSGGLSVAGGFTITRGAGNSGW
ncbi:right-handed parallel beta-helix repeat-containing protein [Streptomyces formicae]|uniref:Right-handed parallel beta-helix repeat-containing protein n=1 Tax=Streptomyces formicae TaxID=1616117 RepID=A0ABY3WIP7_9ACTN|nr:CBM35 domain-containing protein [Streptomyces formicae]UNM10401.1 right-handed parallel beta-helix repeat-containing protein [Streptomyces formicae]